MDAAARHIAAAAFATRRKFVHLVEINDAVLGFLHLAAGASEKIAHEIIDVAAHVAGLTELGGIRFHERDADEFRRRTDQMRFAHARWSQQENVLLLVKWRGLPGQCHPDVLEMIAKRDAQHLFGLSLSDDKAIEVTRNVGRFQAEAEFNRRRFGCLGDSGFRDGVVLRTPGIAQFFGNTRRDGARSVGMTGGMVGHARHVKQDEIANAANSGDNCGKLQTALADGGCSTLRPDRGSAIRSRLIVSAVGGFRGFWRPHMIVTKGWVRVVLACWLLPFAGKKRR